MNLKRLRRKRKAKMLRRQLLKALGNACRCGRKRKLEIDHVDGTTWIQRQTNSTDRVFKYWREYLAGVKLRAACRTCNAGYNPKRINR